ncbi:MAG: hypothetical protein ACRC4M_03120 [Mycoplasma sp.]
MKKSKLYKLAYKYIKFIQDMDERVLLSNFISLSLYLFLEDFVISFNRKASVQNLTAIPTDLLYDLLFKTNLTQKSFKKEILSIYKPWFSKTTKQKEILEILWMYLEIYQKHSKLYSFSYFYEKSYDQKKNDKSVETFADIIVQIEVLNNSIKQLMDKNYSTVIKFVKDSFLRIKSGI